MIHRVFELSFIYSFHTKFDLSRFVAFRKFFSAIRLAAKTNHFVSFKFNLEKSRSTFALWCMKGDKPVMLVSIEFFTEFRFDQILHVFCRNSEVVAVSIHF